MPPIPAPESRNPERAADGQTLNSVASEPGRAQNKWLLSLSVCLSSRNYFLLSLSHGTADCGTDGHTHL